MSYFERGRAAKAAYHTVLVLILFILVVVFIVKFPEIAFPVMFFGFAAIAILALWFLIYKMLK